MKCLRQRWGDVAVLWLFEAQWPFVRFRGEVFRANMWRCHGSRRLATRVVVSPWCVVDLICVRVSSQSLFVLGTYIRDLRSRSMASRVSRVVALVSASCVVPVVGRHTRVDIHYEAALGGQGLPRIAPGVGAGGAGFLSAPPPVVDDIALERETQSPMVWLNLHKSDVPMRSSKPDSFLGAASHGMDPEFGDIVRVFEHAPVEMFEDRSDINAASAVMQQLGAQPRPASPIASRVLVPPRHHAMASCDRDFAQPCPNKFEPVGGGKCAPTSDYQGPCGGAHSFGLLSAVAKGRWSDLCSAWWPCVACQRDFFGICPSGWEVDAEARCKPTREYMGPCDAPVDFAGYTRGMLVEWSSTCDAHWPCASSAAAGSQ